MILRGGVVTACALTAFAAAALGAQAALKPEAPPHHSHGTSLRPVPGRVATSTESSTVSLTASSTASTSVPAQVLIAPVSVVRHSSPMSRAPQRPAARRARPVVQHHGRPIGFRDAADFVDLRAVTSRGASAWLLVSGLLLVLLVIGETAFLRLAVPPLGRREPSENALPIRPVQLRG
jgi:hypothetical protein